MLAVIEVNGFEKLILLASYFQLESRRNVRMAVLKIVNYLLNLSVVIARHLISTVFIAECVQGTVIS